MKGKDKDIQNFWKDEWVHEVSSILNTSLVLLSVVYSDSEAADSRYQVGMLLWQWQSKPFREQQNVRTEQYQYYLNSVYKGNTVHPAPNSYTKKPLKIQKFLGHAPVPYKWWVFGSMKCLGLEQLLDASLLCTITQTHIDSLTQKGPTYIIFLRTPKFLW